MEPIDPATGAAFHLRLWGVRGSVPTPTAANQHFGGNTACVEVCTSGDDLVILDAGTGIRSLAHSMATQQGLRRPIHIFLTHFHWDHIQGLPCFPLLYEAGRRVTFYSAHPPAELRAVLAAQMHGPYFPVSFDDLSASMEFRQISAEPLRLGELGISCFPLHHPQGSVGFRVAHPQRTAIYATDHEHGDAGVDRGLREISQNADVLIYDAQYTPQEHRSRRGWGHSTWLEATCVARDAGVRQLVLFHHDPDRDDEAIRNIAAEARLEFAATVAAREGMEL